MSGAEILTVGTIRTIPTMPPPPPMPEPILAAVTLVVTVRAGILLLLLRRRLLTAARDERRKTADILSALMTALVRLRIRLLLGVLRAILDLLVTWRERLRISRQIRLLLWLARPVTRFVLAHKSLIVVIVAIVGIVAAGLLRLAARRALLMLRLLLIVVRVLLTKLFLRSGDQAEVVLGVLIIILGRHRVARTLRVARELDVFFRHVRSGAADFDVGTVRFVNAREGILTFAVVASPAHALLTVSHDVPVRQPFSLSRHSRRTLDSICKSKQVQTNSIARADLHNVRANGRNVVSCIAIVAATPLPRSQPQRCQSLVTRIVLGFEK